MCHISAQIYGLRWCRLLLGREFTAENSLLFKLWDFMFACCYEAETCSNDALVDPDALPNINSVLASVRVSKDNQHSNQARRNISSLGTVKHEHPNESSAPEVPNYVCTPLLGALGDLMLAMMLHVSSFSCFSLLFFLCSLRDALLSILVRAWNCVRVLIVFFCIFFLSCRCGIRCWTEMPRRCLGC